MCGPLKVDIRFCTSASSSLFARAVITPVGDGPFITLSYCVINLPIMTVGTTPSMTINPNLACVKGELSQIKAKLFLIFFSIGYIVATMWNTDDFHGLEGNR